MRLVQRLLRKSSSMGVPPVGVYVIAELRCTRRRTPAASAARQTFSVPVVHRVMHPHGSPGGHQRGRVHDGVHVPHRLGQGLRLTDVSRVHGDASVA